MAHRQPVLVRLQLSQDAGLAVLPRSPSQARTAPGSADPCDVSTVSLGPSVIMMWVAALATSKTMRRCVTGPAYGRYRSSIGRPTWSSCRPRSDRRAAACSRADTGGIMATFQNTVTIRRAIEDVFAFLADFENVPA